MSNYCYTTVKIGKENDCHGPFAPTLYQCKLGIYPLPNCFESAEDYRRLKNEYGYSYLILDYDRNMNTHPISSYLRARTAGWRNSEIMMSIPATIVHLRTQNQDAYAELVRILAELINAGGQFYGFIYHEPADTYHLPQWYGFLRDVQRDTVSNLLPRLYIIANYDMNKVDDSKRYWTELSSPFYVHGMMDDSYHDVLKATKYWHNEFKIMRSIGKNAWSLFINMGTKEYYRDIDKYFATSKSFIRSIQSEEPSVLWNYPSDLCRYIYDQIFSHFDIINEKYAYVDGDSSQVLLLGVGGGSTAPENYPDVNMQSFYDKIAIDDARRRRLAKGDYSPSMFVAFNGHLRRNGDNTEYELLSYINVIYNLLSDADTIIQPHQNNLDDRFVYNPNFLDDIPEVSLREALSRFKTIRHDSTFRQDFIDFVSSCRPQYMENALIGNGGQCGCQTKSSVDAKMLQCSIFWDRLKVYSVRACANGWLRPAPVRICNQTWMYRHCNQSHPPQQPPPGYGTNDPWNYPGWIPFGRPVCYFDGVLLDPLLPDTIFPGDNDNESEQGGEPSGMKTFGTRSFAV